MKQTLSPYTNSQIISQATKNKHPYSIGISQTPTSNINFYPSPIEPNKKSSSTRNQGSTYIDQVQNNITLNVLSNQYNLPEAMKEKQYLRGQYNHDQYYQQNDEFIKNSDPQSHYFKDRGIKKDIQQSEIFKGQEELLKLQQKQNYSYYIPDIDPQIPISQIRNFHQARNSSQQQLSKRHQTNQMFQEPSSILQDNQAINTNQSYLNHLNNFSHFEKKSSSQFQDNSQTINFQAFDNSQLSDQYSSFQSVKNQKYPTKRYGNSQQHSKDRLPISKDKSRMISELPFDLMTSNQEKKSIIQGRGISHNEFSCRIEKSKNQFVGSENVNQRVMSEDRSYTPQLGQDRSLNQNPHISYLPKQANDSNQLEKQNQIRNDYYNQTNQNIQQYQSNRVNSHQDQLKNTKYIDRVQKTTQKVSQSNLDISNLNKRGDSKDINTYLYHNNRDLQKQDQYNQILVPSTQLLQQQDYQRSQSKSPLSSHNTSQAQNFQVSQDQLQRKKSPLRQQLPYYDQILSLTNPIKGSKNLYMLKPQPQIETQSTAFDEQIGRNGSSPGTTHYHSTGKIYSEGQGSQKQRPKITLKSEKYVNEQRLNQDEQKSLRKSRNDPISVSTMNYEMQNNIQIQQNKSVFSNDDAFYNSQYKERALSNQRQELSLSQNYYGFSPDKNESNKHHHLLNTLSHQENHLKSQDFDQFSLQRNQNSSNQYNEVQKVQGIQSQINEIDIQKNLVLISTLCSTYQKDKVFASSILKLVNEVRDQVSSISQRSRQLSVDDQKFGQLSNLSMMKNLEELTNKKKYYKNMAKAMKTDIQNLKQKIAKQNNQLHIRDDEIQVLTKSIAALENELVHIRGLMKNQGQTQQDTLMISSSSALGGRKPSVKPLDLSKIIKNTTTEQSLENNLTTQIENLQTLKESLQSRMSLHQNECFNEIIQECDKYLFEEKAKNITLSPAKQLKSFDQALKDQLLAKINTHLDASRVFYKFFDDERQFIPQNFDKILRFILDLLKILPLREDFTSPCMKNKFSTPSSSERNKKVSCQPNIKPILNNQQNKNGKQRNVFDTTDLSLDQSNSQTVKESQNSQNSSNNHNDQSQTSSNYPNQQVNQYKSQFDEEILTMKSLKEMKEKIMQEINSQLEAKVQQRIYQAQSQIENNRNFNQENDQNISEHKQLTKEDLKKEIIAILSEQNILSTSKQGATSLKQSKTYMQIYEERKEKLLQDTTIKVKSNQQVNHLERIDSPESNKKITKQNLSHQACLHGQSGSLLHQDTTKQKPSIRPKEKQHTLKFQRNTQQNYSNSATSKSQTTKGPSDLNKSHGSNSINKSQTREYANSIDQAPKLSIHLQRADRQGHVIGCDGEAAVFYDSELQDHDQQNNFSHLDRIEKVIMSPQHSNSDYRLPLQNQSEERKQNRPKIRRKKAKDRQDDGDDPLLHKLAHAEEQLIKSLSIENSHSRSNRSRINRSSVNQQDISGDQCFNANLSPQVQNKIMIQSPPRQFQEDFNQINLVMKTQFQTQQTQLPNQTIFAKDQSLQQSFLQIPQQQEVFDLAQSIVIEDENLLSDIDIQRASGMNTVLTRNTANFNPNNQLLIDSSLNCSSLPNLEDALSPNSQSHKGLNNSNILSQKVNPNTSAGIIDQQDQPDFVQNSQTYQQAVEAVTHVNNKMGGYGVSPQDIVVEVDDSKEYDSSYYYHIPANTRSRQRSKNLLESGLGSIEGGSLESQLSSFTKQAAQESIHNIRTSSKNDDIVKMKNNELQTNSETTRQQSAERAKEYNRFGFRNRNSNL